MKKRSWGKIFLPLSLALALLLCSCAHSFCSPDLSLLRSPFTCELSWHWGSAEFRASYASLGNGSSTLSLLSPDSLRGLCVSLSPDGSSSISLDGLDLGASPRLYLYILLCLDARGSFDYVGRSSDALCYSCPSTGCLWYFSAVSGGRPLRIEGEELSIEIIWIESYENPSSHRQA